MKTRMLLFILIWIIMIFITKAQSNNLEVTLTFAVPSNSLFSIEEQIFADFEQRHPGVNVILVESDVTPIYLTNNIGLPTTLDAFYEYVSSADVLYISSEMLSPIITETRYLLDIEPLIASSVEAISDKFFPNVWSSFQWGGGTWAIPISATFKLMLYDTVAFDVLGLNYPSGDWTVSELASSLSDLQSDEVPSLLSFNNTALMMRLLTGSSLYEPAFSTESPQFNNSDVESALQLWVELESAGLVDRFQLDLNYDSSTVPIRIDSLSFLNNQHNPSLNYSLLPGNIAGMQVDGVAVSSGTDHPELAYELAVYLSTLPQLPLAFDADISARTDVVNDGGTLEPYVKSSLPIETDRVLQEILPYAISPSSLHYGSYFDAVIDGLISNGIETNIVNALETTVQQQIEEASQRREDIIDIVSLAPTSVPAPNTFRINFGVNPVTDIIPNEAAWENAVAEFVANEAQVEGVDLNTGFYTILDAANFDCFYLPYQTLPFPPEGLVLNLDPLINTDVNFDEGNIVPSILENSQADGSIWSYPIHIYPATMFYNPEQFQIANLDSPDISWTISNFDNMLTSSEFNHPVITLSRSTAFMYIQMWVSAYGSLLFDYRTYPPTIDFTEPNTVSALRNILNLIKENVIAYDDQPITSQLTSPFFADTLSFNFGSQLFAPRGYEWLLTPRGESYTPVSYNVGVAYVSASTLHPEACYRWIQSIAQNPALFAGLPVFESILNSPEMEASRSPEELAFLRSFNEVFFDSNLLTFPYPIVLGGSDRPGDNFEQFWFIRAIENVIYYDNDLETELANAETFIENYRLCTEIIAPLNIDGPLEMSELGTYFNQYNECVFGVDPSIREYFGF